jgi:hypothetical protein
MIESDPDVAHPWVDVRIEAASVWGVRGTCIGRAAAYDGPAIPVAPPIVDLLSV